MSFMHDANSQQLRHHDHTSKTLKLITVRGLGSVLLMATYPTILSAANSRQPAGIKNNNLSKITLHPQLSYIVQV